MAKLNFGRPANDDMVQGYRDGRDLTSPEPSGNRSHSYRHGFKAGRNDSLKAGQPFSRLSFEQIIQMADDAMERDELESKLIGEAWRKS